ncbi:sulfotransferase [Ectothiorhodospira variabilis]|uniref:sulfotransferase n=1 Tax=Ectothiorhodospira variabilis TaxID=505694 RepID=UPI001EFC228E|nr:sulfotransferase [Ectothiorhodospira variabilis]MCG5495991.1 sulfotransferase [Ectothiorhodospira variabilis]MCG5505346.1 sulfotransferase [Ectothiorhodospira variabilis]MCG5508532.1 sulfotransferase [Ectothiorhodospira variabilis]
MNTALTDLGNNFHLDSNQTEPKLPIIFIIGSQRSGTTILTQAMARLYRLSYPTNLIARFWGAPFLGAVVTRSLGIGSEGPQSFTSSFGATTDLTGPHEFSYFWRSWFPGSADDARPQALTADRAQNFKRQLAAWQSVTNEPLLFKNLLEVVPNIAILAKMLPSAVFLNIEREDLFVIQSTFESRIRYSGRPDTWFGVKPSQFKKIQRLHDPLTQVVEQVFWVKREISEALDSLESERSLTVTYESLVSSPDSVLATIEETLQLMPYRRASYHSSKLSIKDGNVVRFTAKQRRKINQKLTQLSNEYGPACIRGARC